MTSIEQTTFTFGTLVQLIGYALGLAVLYFKMKGRMDKIENCVKGYVKRNDEDKKKIVQDLSDLEVEFSDKSEALSEKIDGIKDMIHKNHISLLQAINSKK